MQQLEGEKLLYRLQYELSNKLVDVPKKIKFNSYTINNVEKIEVKIREDEVPFHELHVYGVKGIRFNERIYENTPMVIQRIYAGKNYEYECDGECIFIKQLRHIGGKRRNLTPEEISIVKKCIQENIMDEEEISEAYNVSTNYIKAIL